MPPSWRMVGRCQAVRVIISSPCLIFLWRFVLLLVQQKFKKPVWEPADFTWPSFYAVHGGTVNLVEEKLWGAFGCWAGSPEAFLSILAWWGRRPMRAELLEMFVALLKLWSCCLFSNEHASPLWRNIFDWRRLLTLLLFWPARGCFLAG